MAFPRWPGDGRLPSAAADTYFTTQALRAGYPVDPIARPDLAAPPPFSAREVLQREMQKERIREEYLSRELVHSRLLLDQQMRHQQELEKPAIRGRHSAALRPESVIRKGRHSAALRPESVIRRQRPVGHGSAREPKSKLPKKASGIKRKAATIEVASDPPSQDKSEWSCSICRVFATNEHDWKLHLNGRRHKVKQESIFCDVCNVRCTSKSMLDSHLNGKSHKEASATLSAKEVVAPLPVKEQQQANQQKQVVEKSSLNCDVCNLECNSEFMLYEHLAGKKHKAKLMQRNKAQGDKPVSAEDNICALPVKEQQQQVVEKSSLNCDVCNLECNSEFMLYNHLAGKKHKAKLMQRNKVQGDKPVPAEDNKLANDKQHGKTQDGVLVTAEGPKFANDMPVTAEQTGEDKSLVTTDSSGQEGKLVTAEESGKALTPVKGPKRRVVVKKARRPAAVGNVAVEEADKTGQADTDGSVVGSVAAETTE